MFCALTALVVCRARRRDDHTVVRIGAFMPFATYDGGVPTETSGGVYKQVAVAAALAATQFNERNASVIEEFGSLGPCDRQLELSLFNTFGRSSDALMEYRNNYEHLDVIVGAANNEISEPLALYCEIDKRPQISFGSGSTALDKYEWFMRTIPSGGEFADRAMMFAMENNWNSIGVLYSENEGESYRESLSPKCVKFHFICKWAFFQSGSSASLDIAISNLVEFRIIFLAFSDADLALVSERLVANKVTTNEHAFVFMDLMSDEALIRATGDVAELVRGGFKMSVEAAYTTDDARLRLQATLKQQMVEDFTSLLDAVEPFGTLDADFFNRAFVFSQICFAFDAVATIGIASCNATPRGEELLAAMKGASFVGVSNVVEFAENGNRKADPLPLNIVNFIGNGTAGLTAICVATWNKDKWEVLDGQQYTFRDGSSTAPADSVVCQPGAYLDESGRCRECPAGKFQPNSGASTCAECLSSSYQDLTGQQGCKLCGENAAVGWEGSPSAKDCRCLAGYYTPTWPLSECHSCDRPSLQNKVVCEGGFTLPYPRDAYWLDVSNSATTKLRAYRCRHAFLCVGGTRPTACAKGYAEAHNGSCLRASGEPVKLGRPNRWCDAGHHFEEPLCEEPKDGRFAVATLAPKCPARVNHILFTILCYAVLFALFAVINDFIRPGYNVLNLVLAVFQDLGILTSFRLYWPKQFQYIIVLYRIALFDVDVLDPTCAFPKWGQAHTFFLTLALPFVHLVIRCAYAAVATSGGLNAWHSTIGSHASFVVTSMPILLMYCMSPFLCRRFVGREQRVFAVSPADSCDSSTANAMRVVASIYFAYVLMVCGICTYHVTVRLHRNELHNPEVLRVYGFLYKPYRSHALYWSSVRLAKQAALSVVSQVLWKSPFSQSLAGLAVLLALAMEHSHVRPFISHQENRFEEFGIFVSVLTLVLGMCFTAFEVSATETSQPGERTTFIFLFIFVQVVYFLYAIVETVRNTRRNADRLTAKKALVRAARDLDGTDDALMKGNRSLLSMRTTISSGDLRHLSERTLRMVSAVRDSVGSSFLHFGSRRSLSSAAADIELSRTDYAMENNVVVPLLSTESLRNMEFFKTFRGAPLRAFFTSMRFWRHALDEIERIVELEGVLASYVSDSALTSNYSNSPKASFYRHLDTSFPFLIDLLMHSTDKRRAILSEAIGIIERYTSLMHAVGDYQDSIIVENIDRSSILFFLTHCGSRARSQFCDFAMKLVDAQPSVRCRRDAAVKIKMALVLQKLWRSRRSRQDIGRCMVYCSSGCTARANRESSSSGGVESKTESDDDDDDDLGSSSNNTPRSDTDNVQINGYSTHPDADDDYRPEQEEEAYFIKSK